MTIDIFVPLIMFYRIVVELLFATQRRRELQFVYYTPAFTCFSPRLGVWVICKEV